MRKDTEESINYAIALQRAIEYHCKGLPIPPKIANLCPYHAKMLDKLLDKILA